MDFPLLYEGGFEKICNYVILVVADEETKIDRIRQRDKIPVEQIEARLNTQIDDDKLKEKADYVVDNSRQVKYINLIRDVIKIIHKIKKEEGESKKT